MTPGRLSIAYALFIRKRSRLFSPHARLTIARTRRHGETRAGSRGEPHRSGRASSWHCTAGGGTIAGTIPAYSVAQESQSVSRAGARGVRLPQRADWGKEARM